MTNIISLKNITKTFQFSEKKVLDNVSLEISKGEFFCLVGPSGSGKSTILKLIAKLENPTMGEIQVNATIGMVFQSGALFPWLTVEENIIFGLKMKGISRESNTARKFLKMVKLEEFENKYPRELSGGQRQRVGIARALAINPEILLLDEPFSALDPLTTEDLYIDLLDIWKETQNTIVMVSHYMEESVLLADSIACVKDSKLIGIVDVNLKRPRNLRDSSFEEKLLQVKSMIS